MVDLVRPCIAHFRPKNGLILNHHCKHLPLWNTWSRDSFGCTPYHDKNQVSLLKIGKL